MYRYTVDTNEHISIDGWRVPPGFKSDGCTCAPDRLLGVDLRAACIWHDWARRHLVHYDALTVQQADALFHRLLIELFKRQDLLNVATRAIARLYWFGNKLLRARFTATRSLPVPMWRIYLKNDPGMPGITVISETLDG